MMADNHYNPIPITDLVVGEEVLFIDANSELQCGTIVALGLKTATMEIDRENPIIGGKLRITVPYSYIWQLPKPEEA